MLEKKLICKFVDVEKNLVIKQQLVQKKKYDMLPLVFINGEYIGGYAQLEKHDLSSIFLKKN